MGLAEQSARRIFGNATGNRKADLLNWKLQKSGKMTLTEISNLFGRNLAAIDLEEIITILVDNGMARVVNEKNDNGKPVVVVCAATSGLN